VPDIYSGHPSIYLISQLLQLNGGQPLLPPYPQGIKEKVGMRGFKKQKAFIDSLTLALSRRERGFG